MGSIPWRKPSLGTAGPPVFSGIPFQPGDSAEGGVWSESVTVGVHLLQNTRTAVC